MLEKPPFNKRPHHNQEALRTERKKKEIPSSVSQWTRRRLSFLSFTRNQIIITEVKKTQTFLKYLKF